MSWIDVKAKHPFFNEITDVSMLRDRDNQLIVAEIPYNVFEEDAPYIYREFVAQEQQRVFTLDVAIVPTEDNPLFIYVDGIQIIYHNTVTDHENGVTKVNLYNRLKAGSNVVIASFGIPKVNDLGRPYIDRAKPIEYPHYKLSQEYFYDSTSIRNQERFNALSLQIKRIHIPDILWETCANSYDPFDIPELLRRRLGFYDNLYTVSPWGDVYTSYNLNDVSCRIIYGNRVIENFKPHSDGVLYTNRFFPMSKATRAEAYVTVSKLLQSFYDRMPSSREYVRFMSDSFIVDGLLKVLDLPYKYDSSSNYTDGRSWMTIHRNDVQLTSGVNYIEINDRQVEFVPALPHGTRVRYSYDKTASAVGRDINRLNYYEFPDGSRESLNGLLGESWWAGHVLDLSVETLSDGSELVQGVEIRNYSYDEEHPIVYVDENYRPLDGDNTPQIWFLPDTPISRWESVQLCNRFRVLCMERFA